MSVNLSKGQAISLEKSGGGGLSTVRMGLGWQAAARKKGGLLKRLMGGGDIDLDASAVLFSGGNAEDVVYFGKLSDDANSVLHTGDNLTGGAGQEDDESIVVMLSRLPQRIDQIVFTVNSFTGQTFTEVERAFCRLLDEDTGEELARYTLAGGGSSTAMIMAKVRRQGAGWQMTAIGAPATGRTFQDLLPAITPHL
ncbi:TerD family protein [Streptomyces specialis]|uniref:TerD family protein n=1 Tax=Streptomyces specialis TaxID=498367 RepID=UPI00073E8211|nr:TerD family protein [Streptomyces specialis]